MRRLPLGVLGFLGALSFGFISACDNTGAACSTNGDCSSGDACVYRIADGCSAKATCQPKPTGLSCLLIISYCGCTGDGVGVRCSDPEGYATAPVSGLMTGATCQPADGGAD